MQERVNDAQQRLAEVSTTFEVGSAAGDVICPWDVADPARQVDRLRGGDERPDARLLRRRIFSRTEE